VVGWRAHWSLCGSTQANLGQVRCPQLISGPLQQWVVRDCVFFLRDIQMDGNLSGLGTTEILGIEAFPRLIASPLRDSTPVCPHLTSLEIEQVHATWNFAWLHTFPSSDTLDMIGCRKHLPPLVWLAEQDRARARILGIPLYY
jgi:hypothetical protein